MQLDDQMTECVDILLTLQLAVTLSERPNAAIRRSWQVIRQRVTHDRNRRVFDGICSQLLPHGGLSTLVRTFRDVLGSKA